MINFLIFYKSNYIKNKQIKIITKLKVFQNLLNLILYNLMMFFYQYKNISNLNFKKYSQFNDLTYKIFKCEAKLVKSIF